MRSCRSTTDHSAGEWLTAGHLADLLPGLLAEAQSVGTGSGLGRTRSGQPDGFLLVAPDDRSASAVNGYFYWLSSQASDDSTEPLLLGIDRLFSEGGREAATASGDYSEPELVNLLDFSLRQVLQEWYKPDMLTFIMSCYRKDFAARLQDAASFTDQTWSGQFQGMEVSYNASIISSVAFQIIPG